MYENEIYSEPGAANHTAGTENSGYFDYISNPGAAATAAKGNAAENGRTASAPRITAGSAAGKVGNNKTKKDRPKKESGTFRKFVLSISLGLCFGLFAGLGFYAVQLGTGQISDQDEIREERDTEEVLGSSITVAQPSNTPEPSYLFPSQDAAGVVKQVMPAMVSIISNSTETTRFWGQTYTQPVAYSGSGIIVAEKDKELLIVTNNHVVEGANSLEITFIDGTTAGAAIKGLDADMDLAVISVRLSELSEDTRNTIAIAILGNSDDLELGEPVIAIGNALGYGQSVSGGMVSALARELTFDDGSTGLFIQTDAAINPGNSGGALLNMRGEVIGINSSKIGGTYIEGMGYAIPITSASPIIAELMERQIREQRVAESERGYLGIQLQLLDASTAQMYGMPQGAYVYSVDSDSAAAAAGLLHGDIIVSFDGQRISSTDELTGAMEYYRAGETVKMTIKRIIDGEYRSVELEVTLGRRP